MKHLNKLFFFCRVKEIREETNATATLAWGESLLCLRVWWITESLRVSIPDEERSHTAYDHSFETLCSDNLSC